jgi:hypothetical protein
LGSVPPRGKAKGSVGKKTAVGSRQEGGELERRTPPQPAAPKNEGRKWWRSLEFPFARGKMGQSKIDSIGECTRSLRVAGSHSHAFPPPLCVVLPYRL